MSSARSMCSKAARLVFSPLDSLPSPSSLGRGSRFDPGSFKACVAPGTLALYRLTLIGPGCAAFLVALLTQPPHLNAVGTWQSCSAARRRSHALRLPLRPA